MMKSKKNERYTTYVDKDQLGLLKQLSEDTGESINRLIGQALDDFFENLDLVEERRYVPLDGDYIKRKYEKNKEEESDSKKVTS